MKNSIGILSSTDEGSLVEVSIGEMVHDDLTGTVVKLLKILDSKTHTNGLIVDSEHLEGYRHPWEVSEVRK